MNKHTETKAIHIGNEMGNIYFQKTPIFSNEMSGVIIPHDKILKRDWSM